MFLKITAIREENLLPVSSLETIKGGAVVTTCTRNDCNTFEGGDCTDNSCIKHFGDCIGNICNVNQGSCSCKFVHLQPPKCPTLGSECPAKAIHVG